jgi:cytochrome c
MNFRPALVAAVLLLAAPPAARAEGDAASGEKIFRKCRACHTLAAEEKHKIGPNLHGLFQRKSGAAEGFRYSKAMKEAGLDWNEASLDKYLSSPKDAIPGNKMAFAGLKKPEERADVIAYLKAATK